MDPKKIGAHIYELRIANNLSQAQLAEKLMVTKQAISKWENGRGIPDIEMILQLSKVFKVSVEELINVPKQDPKKKDRKKAKYLIVILLIVILTVVSLIFLIKPGVPKNDGFEFNRLASDNDKFAIKGVIAYNKNKKSIYISDIKYSAIDSEEKEYVVAECILYEKNANSENKLSQCGDINNLTSFNEKDAKTLTNLLKDVEFNVDNYACSCGNDSCNNLYLRINAINVDNKTVTYNIPIQVDNQCSKDR